MTTYQNQEVGASILEAGADVASIAQHLLMGNVKNLKKSTLATCPKSMEKKRQKES
ncbi:hypothetical protein [Formosimonas limnophila]|uniref:hypothetical protein n=1 Tax=Formosimonas limnophila TaxID=1384487 RepID=UPI001678BF99|nr:hypothetical protein [Formosimonas limnophila]